MFYMETLFPHHRPFVRGIHRWPMDSPHKGPVMLSFRVLFVVGLHTTLKHSSGRWLETLWESCDIIISNGKTGRYMSDIHDDVIKWKHFQLYWACVRGIHRSPVNSFQKGQWRGALMLPSIYSWKKQFSEQSRCGWFETSLRSLWRHCNVLLLCDSDLNCVWSTHRCLVTPYGIRNLSIGQWLVAYLVSGHSLNYCCESLK